MASQMPFSDSATTFPDPPMKSRITAGCRNAPRMPAKTAEPIRASEAGTFLIDRKASRTRGSRFRGVMW
ncbi:hypothetical protein [Streptomyces sp. H39-S7]|uniref:hypothetical protein n=1 Tax=Streptomyces sp. H39-S7 TaxID=3004357 RepID=UPI0022AECFC0|nr:hypothetical protein [Streptomyces sp. H39-S7]MCZ4121023.1 hypothetical protein [Streptomyces sp. H39-S7]